MTNNVEKIVRQYVCIPLHMQFFMIEFYAFLVVYNIFMRDLSFIENCKDFAYTYIKYFINQDLINIQNKRIKELEAEGYYVIKLIKTNKNGIPDIIAIPEGSEVLFSEVKKPNGRLSILQQYRLKELNKYGFKTEVYRG